MSYLETIDGDGLQGTLLSETFVVLFRLVARGVGSSRPSEELLGVAGRFSLRVLSLKTAADVTGGVALPRRSSLLPVRISSTLLSNAISAFGSCTQKIPLVYLSKAVLNASTEPIPRPKERLPYSTRPAGPSRLV